MAFSSFNSKLMVDKESNSSWAAVCAIKGIPQIGGEPEQIETTTLNDRIQTFIDGIQSQEAMSFTINADKTERDANIKPLRGLELPYSIWLGNNGLGEQGKFTGKAKLDYYINSADVNSVVEMTIVLTPTAPFEEEETA